MDVAIDDLDVIRVKIVDKHDVTIAEIMVEQTILYIFDYIESGVNHVDVQNGAQNTKRGMFRIRKSQSNHMNKKKRRNKQ